MNPGPLSSQGFGGRPCLEMGTTTTMMPLRSVQIPRDGGNVGPPTSVALPAATYFNATAFTACLRLHLPILTLFLINSTNINHYFII